MADRLDAFPPSTRRYAWNDWLNGEIWRLTPGVDFDSSVVTFKGLVYQASYRRNRTTMIRTDDQGRLIIQSREARR